MIKFDWKVNSEVRIRCFMRREGVAPSVRKGYDVMNEFLL